MLLWTKWSYLIKLTCTSSIRMDASMISLDVVDDGTTSHVHRGQPSLISTSVELFMDVARRTTWSPEPDALVVATTIANRRRNDRGDFMIGYYGMILEDIKALEHYCLYNNNLWSVEVKKTWDKFKYWGHGHGAGWLNYKVLFFRPRVFWEDQGKRREKRSLWNRSFANPGGGVLITCRFQ